MALHSASEQAPIRAVIDGGVPMWKRLGHILTR
jgi:hypothetical protein